MIGTTLPLSCTAKALAWDSRPSSTLPDFRQRLINLRTRIASVDDALDQSEGLVQSAGRIDLQIARYFARYITWELDHPGIMKEALAANSRYAGQEKLNAEQREQRYHDHLEYERTSAMRLLDQALRRLETDDKRPATDTIPWEKMVYQDGCFRVDGRPVYPGGFNMLGRRLVDRARYPQWTEADETRSRAFLPEMKTMGVGVIGVGVPVTRLVTQTGDIDPVIVRNLIAEIKEYEQLGFKVDLLLHWSGNGETLEARWPGITRFGGNGVNLDIDHPGTHELVRESMARLIPALRDIPAILSWDLANEPFFDLDDWSPHTRRSYHAWLAERHGTIAALNHAWQTDYPDFRTIPLPKDKPRERCAPGEWYDRITFHNYRVVRFFNLVADEIRRHHPKAIIHIKGQDNNSLGPKPWAVTDGIDREMMTPFIDLHGLDTRPLPVTEPRMAVEIEPGKPDAILNYDASLYRFHWLGQSFLYDYLTSLDPGKPIVDFEYHAFSINPIRIPRIPQGHARATLWLAHLHGLVGNMTWYWHRRYGPNPFPTNYFESWFFASISTQPLVAAEYFHTMSELNRFADEITALARTSDRPIRLLVSKPSYIQNQNHINALHRAHEATCFHGLRTGFVTEDMLTRDGIPADCTAIIIPDAQYVSAAALRQLKRAQQQGVKLIRFGKYGIAFNEYGRPHAPGTLAFLRDTPIADHASAPDLSRKLGRLLEPFTKAPPVVVQRAGRDDAFGVMHRQVRLPDGRRILLLANLLDQPVSAHLTTRQGDPVIGFDLLRHEETSKNTATLPVYGLRLIQITD